MEFAGPTERAREAIEPELSTVPSVGASKDGRVPPTGDVLPVGNILGGIRELVTQLRLKVFVRLETVPDSSHTQSVVVGKNNSTLGLVLLRRIGPVEIRKVHNPNDLGSPRHPPTDRSQKVLEPKFIRK